MNAQQAKQLLPQTVVMWEDNPNDLGTVLEINKNGVLIKWERWPYSGDIAFTDMERVSLYAPAEATHD